MANAKSKDGGENVIQIPVPAAELERLARKHRDHEMKLEFLSKQLDLAVNYMQQIALFLGVRGRIEELDARSTELSKEKKSVFETR